MHCGIVNHSPDSPAALGDPDIQSIKSTLLSFGCNGVKLMQQSIGAQVATPNGRRGYRPMSAIA